MSPIILDPRAPPPPPLQLQGMSLSDAQNELMARGFDYLPAPRQTIMLNDAKNQFEDTWEFPWLYRLNTGAAPLAFSDLKYVLTVKDQSSRELLGIDIRQLAENGTDLSAAGQPDYWYLTDDHDDLSTLMRTWPVNDGPLTVAYIAQSPELVNPSDVPLIPARYHPIWIDLAVVQAYQDSDNFVAAQALQADIAARLQQVIERFETRNRQHAVFNTVRMFNEDD